MADSLLMGSTKKEPEGILPAERRSIILKLLERDGNVRLSTLQELLPVSLMTIRRDLVALERQGLLKRTYGGAVIDNSTSFEPPFIIREDQLAAEKRAIGIAAAQLISDGETILLDSGTTTLQIARNLVRKRDIKILTTSIPIATEAARHRSLSVTLLGGTLRGAELSLVGRLAERALREFYVDKAFLTVGGLDLERGLTTYDEDEAAIKKIMIQAAKCVIAVTDHSKIGHVTFAHVGPLSDIDVLVTDDGLDPEIRRELRDRGIEVLACSTQHLAE